VAATALAALIATPLTYLVVRTNIKQRNRSDDILTA
jgi:hypothetical protein